MENQRPGNTEAEARQQQSTSWWDEHGDAVEGKLIDLLMAKEPRTPYTGPERRSRASIQMQPEDAVLVREQAARLGVSFEEHTRRIFHDAVMAEQRRLSFTTSSSPGSKLKPCKTVEPWPSMSAKSA